MTAQLKRAIALLSDITKPATAKALDEIIKRRNDAHIKAAGMKVK